MTKLDQQFDEVILALIEATQQNTIEWVDAGTNTYKTYIGNVGSVEIKSTKNSTQITFDNDSHHTVHTMEGSLVRELHRIVRAKALGAETLASEMLDVLRKLKA